MKKPEVDPTGVRKIAQAEKLTVEEVMERTTHEEDRAEELRRIEDEIAEQQYADYLEAQRDYYDAYDPYYDYDDLPPLDDLDYDPWWDDY